MTTRNMSFTYPPKIEPVHLGLCDQSIRAGRRINMLDELLLFTWSGKPYRSPWLWRKRAICTEAIPIRVCLDGISLSECTRVPIRWDTPWMDSLASRDFINPPTGVELGRVLLKFHKIGEDGEQFQIIRWKNL